jgi:hypothetical protein
LLNWYFDRDCDGDISVKLDSGVTYGEKERPVTSKRVYKQKRRMKLRGVSKNTVKMKVLTVMTLLPHV